MFYVADTDEWRTLGTSHDMIHSSVCLSQSPLVLWSERKRFNIFSYFMTDFIKLKGKNLEIYTFKHLFVTVIEEHQVELSEVELV